MSSESVLSFLVPVLLVIGVGLGVAAIAYFWGRAKSNQGLAIPFRPLLLAYLYLLSAVSLLLFFSGVSQLVRAGLTLPLGREFSYFSPPLPRVEIAKPPPPDQSYYGPKRVYPQPQESPPRPNPEELEAQRQKALQRSFREGVLNGVSYTVIGALLFGLHRYGRRRLGAEENGSLHRLYLIALLLVFALITVFSLPAAVYEALRFYWLPTEEYYRQPGARLATAIAALPFWLYYLRLVLQQKLAATPPDKT